MARNNRRLECVSTAVVRDSRDERTVAVVSAKLTPTQGDAESTLGLEGRLRRRIKLAVFDWTRTLEGREYLRKTSGGDFNVGDLAEIVRDSAILNQSLITQGVYSLRVDVHSSANIDWSYDERLYDEP